MNRIKYWIILEFVTIVIGSFISVLKYLDQRPSNLDTAFGVSLVVLGIMIRLWRKEINS